MLMSLAIIWLVVAGFAVGFAELVTSDTVGRDVQARDLLATSGQTPTAAAALDHSAVRKAETVQIGKVGFTESRLELS